MTSVAAVTLWGSTVGAVSLTDDGDCLFEWEPAFVRSGIEPSPIYLPLDRTIYRFPTLRRETFRGLPGMLADLLPGQFGQTLMDAWYAFRDRKAHQVSILDRLRLVSGLGMGALRLEPAGPLDSERSEPVEMAQLLPLLREIVGRRHNLGQGFIHQRRIKPLLDCVQAGCATGGSQPKLLLAWNPDTGEFRSGPADAGLGFSDWLVKLDGMPGNRFREREYTRHQGAVEFAYFLMARDCGIDISESRLEENNNRRHFMTRRFDRLPNGSGLHMQSISALAHIDWRNASGYSYEQVLLTPRQLGLKMDATEQLFRRMVFNVVGRNQNDHVNKVSFLMNKTGHWQLAPAYDLTYSYKSGNPWNGRHRMTINGKVDELSLDDFRACARTASIRRGLVRQCIEETQSVFRRWPDYAERAGLDRLTASAIGHHHRTEPFGP